MNKKSSNVFFIVSLAVSVILVLGACLSLYLYAQDGRKRAEVSFERLGSLLSSVQRPEDLRNPILRSDLAAFYRDSPTLLLISVYERGTGVLWRLPAASNYLPASQNTASIPQPSYPSNSSILFSAPLRGDSSGSLAVDALYVSLSQGRVFSVLRDLCLALAAYLALACIVLFISSLKSARAGRSETAGREETVPAPQSPLPDGGAAAGFPYTDEGLSGAGADAVGADAEEPAAEPAQAETAEAKAAEGHLDGAGSAGPGSEEGYPAYPRPEDDFSVPDIPAADGDSGGEAGLVDIDAGQEAEAEAGAMASVLAVGSGQPDPAADAAVQDSVGQPEPQAGAAVTRAGLKSGEGLYSPLSGLGWESYLHDRLEAELARSASFEQDLSLLFVSYDGISPEKPEYKAMASLIGKFFTFKDLSFERGPDGFAVVMPNIDADHALKMAEEFLKQLEIRLGGTRKPLDYMPVFIGLSSRSGRLVDAVRLGREAESALMKAQKDRDTHIVAFKPDPDKYRHYLSERGK